MASSSSSSPSLLLQLFCLSALLLSSPSLHCSSSSHAERGGDEKTHHVRQVKSLLPNRVCSSAKATNTTSLKIVHRHGPCSPFRSKPPSLTKILLLDESRAESLRQLHRRSRPLTTKADDLAPDLTDSLATIPAKLGRSYGSSNYIVTIGLGTPKKDFTVVFDTGSDLTWVQCQPCVAQCYTQQDPIFDPSLSSTYKNVSCSAPECSALASATGRTGCSASNCLYGIQYGDNSNSVGFFARETLTLSPYDTMPNFLFGCGEKNKGLFGQTAGLLGLGRDPVSLTSQGSQKYAGVFSYCLPSSSSSTGYLKLGPDASQASVHFTPMLTDSTMASFYFLDLIGIKVAGRLLPISATIFQSAGTIIDSGTVITRLPPTAYSALRSAFRPLMSKYPTAPAFSILDTCYNLTNYDTVVIPTVEVLFRGGATVKVDASGILVVATASQVCLAFAPNGSDGDVGIFGNMQQRTFTVVYDSKSRGIGFAALGCR